MPTATKNITANFGGKGFSLDLGNVTNQGEINSEISLPVGKLASSWVKTDADTAACSLAASHGIVTGKVDVYFAAGSRYGVDAVVTGNNLTLDGGAGTDFPANGASDVVISQQVTVSFNVIGNQLKYLGLVNVNANDTTGKVSADIQSSAPASLVRYSLVHQKLANGMVAILDIANGETNPLTGVTAATIRCSNSSLTYAATFHAYALYDATP